MEDALKKRGVFGTADYVSPEVRTFATVDSHAMDNTRRVFGNASYASPESAPAAKLHGLPEQRARATGAGHGGACRHEAVGVTRAGRASGAGRHVSCNKQHGDRLPLGQRLTHSLGAGAVRPRGVVRRRLVGARRDPLRVPHRATALPCVEALGDVLEHPEPPAQVPEAGRRPVRTESPIAQSSPSGRVGRVVFGGKGGHLARCVHLGVQRAWANATAVYTRATRVPRTHAHGWLRFQAEVPARFKDIIDQLLTVNPKFRLGSPTRNGAQSVMQAPPQPEPQRTHFHAHASSRDTRTLAHTHSLLHAFTHARTHARTHMRTS